MDTATTAVTIVSITAVVAAKTCALLSLWLRLRWRARRERAHRQCLLGIAETVAANGRGGLVEFDDRYGDGCHVRMRVTCAPDRRLDSAA
ncbi:hypothetical protein ACWCQQ_21300 [Streptomyces sp. NPDC002143]